MGTAGILLTGGRSQRMGIDKATLPFRGEPLAARTARLLEACAAPVLEVGPGYTSLPVVSESPPGSGPLAAIAAAAGWMAQSGFGGPALVVATDLPLLDLQLLGWLARHPSPRSIVPVDGGRPQPLCARYAAADLAESRLLVQSGSDSMRDLMAAIDPLFIDSNEWQAVAGQPTALLDVDTPEDLRLAGQAEAGQGWMV